MDRRLASRIRKQARSLDAYGRPSSGCSRVFCGDGATGLKPAASRTSFLKRRRSTSTSRDGLGLMPPSARSAAPLVRRPLRGHIDHHVGDLLDAGKRCNSEVGRNCLTNTDAASSTDWPFCFARPFTNVSTPSDIVGPGSTELTVTAVPRVISARPRDTASCAVLVTP